MQQFLKSKALDGCLVDRRIRAALTGDVEAFRLRTLTLMLMSTH